ncbi:MAG: hypothetical protein H6782_00145 [Candidatus Nomurabacteria bacterium]|nr:MAG: hypothetical protein H6782_00145 [Candidatus Nomurabacteria bacterium]
MLSIQANLNCPRRLFESEQQKTPELIALSLYHKQKCFLYQSKYYVAKSLLMSHLRLGGKVVAVAAGDAPQNGSVYAPTQWAALRAAHSSVGFEPTSSILVRRAGFEPA